MKTIYTERRKIPELKERDSLLENQNVINLKNQIEKNTNPKDECEC